jgi:hypothetical protein
LSHGLSQRAGAQSARRQANRGEIFSMNVRCMRVILCAGLLLTAVPASAQYGSRGGLPDPATGESYRIEASGNLWNPSPTLLITSEALGIVGDQIDFVEDFGLEKSTFRQLKLALRPARKHKLRFEYTPIKYEQEANISRSLVFNGQRFNVSLPVLAELKWNAMRFGYEYDFIYRDRGYVGLLLEAKYTDVEAALSNIVIGREYASARAPIPAIGFTGRGYVLPNVSITGEFSFFKLPESIDENYQGTYYDFDLYGTVNFTNNVGAQAGYRSLTVFYRVDTDSGDMKLKGLYFGGVLRF